MKFLENPASVAPCLAFEMHDDVVGEFSELFVYEHGNEYSARILLVIRRTKLRSGGNDSPK